MYSIENMKWRKHFRDHVLIRWFVQCICWILVCKHLIDNWSKCWILKLIWFETSTTRRQRRLIRWWQRFHCDEYFDNFWFDRKICQHDIWLRYLVLIWLVTILFCLRFETRFCWNCFECAIALWSFKVNRILHSF